MQYRFVFQTIYLRGSKFNYGILLFSTKSSGCNRRFALGATNLCVVWEHFFTQSFVFHRRFRNARKFQSGVGNRLFFCRVLRFWTPFKYNRKPHIAKSLNDFRSFNDFAGPEMVHIAEPFSMPSDLTIFAGLCFFKRGGNSKTLLNHKRFPLPDWHLWALRNRL